MKRALAILPLLLGLPLAAPALAAAPTAQEIVQRTDQVAYYAAQDGRAKVRMRITDPQGRTRTRQFIILRRDGSKPGEQKYYVYFQRPADLAQTVFMVWKHANTDDDRWLYLPGLDLVKRIAAADRRTSFAGSDFLYEDVSGRSITEDHHELEEATDRFFVLKNTPKDPASVEFSYYRMWIHKKTYLPIKVVFYDKAQKPMRQYTALEVKTISGHPTVTKSSMKNLQSGSETILQFRDIAYDIQIPDAVFSERYLRTAPTAWLR